ncbi:MAG: TolC family protein [Chitinophagaceae bacterium]|nr:TolC family protein [Chitinophagaceae bacterium]
MKKLIFLILLFLSGNVNRLWAQSGSQTLAPEEVLQIIRSLHPVAKQADILVEKAKADITISRGAFDPYLKNTSAQKTFDGSDYYYYNRPSVNIPTWFGIEVEAGLEYLSGSRTDPTETSGETSYIGLSVPLAKNLLMDKRRAALKTAQIFQEASEQERRLMLNDLFLNAMEAYWEWAKQFQQYKILEDAVEVNRKRLTLVRNAFLLGDRAAIDTTEALAQLQNFEYLRDQALLEFRNAGLLLSTFLWTDKGTPYELPATVRPSGEWQAINTNLIAEPRLDSLLEVAQTQHPALRVYDYKLRALDVEKKLKFQGLLPTVDFKYNQLGKGYDILKTATGPLFENSFQYGLSLGIPLRLSEGRGEYRKAKLKIDETRWQQDQKQLEIGNKLRAYYNEWKTLQQQIRIQEQAYRNYLALQKAEELRFESGESSLFLVNSRENKTLEALQKLQELRAKFFKTGYAITWATGGL